MKKILLIPLILFCFYSNSSAQKYFTRSGEIKFSSDAPMEKIEAVNNSVTSVLDAGSGKMEFAVLIKAFQFEKALMQEHFNENYMESSKFPKAKFKGQIQDLSIVHLDKNGAYEVEVAGQLTIHGQTKDISTKGTLNVKDGQLSASANFEVAVADYGIEIPAVVRDNIAKTVLIIVAINNYQVLNQ